jgi:CRISPR-associated endonuclease Csy4
MKFFLDLFIYPDECCNVNFILSKIYKEIHRRIVATRINVGIDFPNYSEKGLGDKIRLFTEKKEELQSFKIEEIIEGFEEFVESTKIRPIPLRKVSEYASIKRVRSTHNSSKLKRLIKREMKRSGKTWEEVFKKYTKDFNIICKNKKVPQFPFVNLESDSTKQKFNLYVKKETCSFKELENNFNSYGLSVGGILPQF